MHAYDSTDLNLQWERLFRAVMDWRRTLLAATLDQVAVSHPRLSSRGDMLSKHVLTGFSPELNLQLKI